MRWMLSGIILLATTVSVAVSQEERKKQETKPNPTDKEAEVAYAKWLATEIPKVGKPLDLVFQIWDGIELHRNQKDHFSKLLDSILKLYRRGGGDDDATIDVCNDLASLFGYPLTGTNLITCQDGLKNVPKLSPKDYERVKKAITEAKEKVKKDP